MKHPNSGPQRGPKTQAEIPTPTSTPTSPPASQSKGESKAQNQGIDGSLVRNGKIARLPAEIREALNRCLAQGVSGPKVLERLNGLPETQALLRREFQGQPISPQNLSQWRQGGFRDWLLKQEAKEVLCEFAAHHRSLAALQLPEQVALWLGSRLVAMAGWVDQQSPDESWPVVHQMIRDVATLRRADYQTRQQQLKERAKHKLNHRELREWALQPGVLDSLRKEAEARKKDGLNAVREASFKLIGVLPGDYPEDLAWEANKRGVPVEQLEEARAAAEREWLAKRKAEQAAKSEQSAQCEGEEEQWEEESESEEQTDQNPPSEEKKKPKQAKARNGKGSRLRSKAATARQARTRRRRRDL